MAWVIGDRVQETTTSTGTGNITLGGSVTGNIPFSSIPNILTNDTIDYLIQNTTGSEWETGIGVYNSSTGQIEQRSPSMSSNSNALVNFSEGTKTVSLTINAETGQRVKNLLFAQHSVVNSSGSVFDQAINANNSTTLAATTNRIALYPFIPSFDLPSSGSVQIGVTVATLVSSNLKLLVYGSDKNGAPNNKIYEGVNLPVSSTGYWSTTLTTTLRAGRLYWIGAWISATPTLRAIPIAGCRALGLANNNSTAYLTAIHRTVTYDTTPGTAPSVWSFSVSELAASVCHSIRFTI